ncbi:MAG TPA: 6-phosphofructokinase, partial [Gammaproteobacteria bacterium]|nr:6-phosphofructokinase [Gammaproteobacteria bacterium]
ILIPEVPFDPEGLCEKIKQRAREGATSSIVAVAEGAKPKGGDVSVLHPGAGVYQPQLGGVGAHVAEMLRGVTQLETRVTVLGHVQRGGSPVAKDRLIATQYGVAAVDALARGEHNRMVTYNQEHLGTVPLEQVAGGFRPVPPHHPLLETAWQLGTILGD